MVIFCWSNSTSRAKASRKRLRDAWCIGKVTADRGQRKRPQASMQARSVYSVSRTGAGRTLGLPDVAIAMGFLRTAAAASCTAGGKFRVVQCIQTMCVSAHCRYEEVLQWRTGYRPCVEWHRLDAFRVSYDNFVTRMSEQRPGCEALWHRIHDPLGIKFRGCGAGC